MKKLLIIAVVLLAGCAAKPPVTREFPAAPHELLQPAHDLTPLKDNERQLSDLLNNANQNYTQYYMLRERYESWQRWYAEQKKIFERNQ